MGGVWVECGWGVGGVWVGCGWGVGWVWVECGWISVCGVLEGWSGGGVEWWRGGVVEGWNGGGVEWWRGGVVEGGIKKDKKHETLNGKSN